MSVLIKISGFFKKILFERENNTYRIFAFKISNVISGKDLIKENKFGTISIVVDKPDLEIELDKQYELIVDRNVNSKYQDSYILLSMDESDDWKLNYIVKFLESSHFKGIGTIKAKNIVEKYGIDTLDRITYDVKISHHDLGMKEEDFLEARRFLKDNPQVVKDQLFFLQLNLSPSFYEKINQNFPNLNAFINKYRNNFYKYYFENKYVSLIDLDKLNDHFQSVDDSYRNAVYLYQGLSNFLFDSGHTKVSINEFYNWYFVNGKQITPNHFKEYLKILINEEYVFIWDNKTYITTKEMFDMENYIVARLKRIKENKNFTDIEVKENKRYHSLQNKAKHLALTQNLVLITGSPGTGKTLITNDIINSLLKKYPKEAIAVVTPTGRATININKQTEIKASTIHSFLMWNVDTNKFEVNERWPERIECLIIDEFSMVSTELFYHLLKGIHVETLHKIILVGDKNQLPAIGAGYLINDFIENNIFETIELTKIYRQAENFDIVSDAISINKQEIPKFNQPHSQFKTLDKQELSSALIKEIQELLKQGYTKKDIAILSPIYNYQTGIDKLNEALNNFWRDKEKEEVIKIGKKTFALNDKVLNTINDPSKKVFNGEIGYISRFDYDEKNNLSKIAISFENDSKTVVFSKKDFIQKVIPAYCTSVHKYQGSECPVVLTVLFNEAKRLLSKKLIYTAITRAQKLSIIFGEYEALEAGINNDSDSQRRTCIKEIWETLNNKE
ncbi:exodeoxyribonuclease V C-terminal fragment [Metamycoplasma cloacale]|uniref:Exodeoxyribonuclease V subunit alpha n=1 Tax=Metamycoplasma cloacale TaxID=92401 RepID=A0A2Z4LLG3_9BACT|nr:AAA family ATPase [Metamycoplasma cloacale]AWX42525.1 exodeoxyribonuclease V subunit alpha [Metamycoplasma cloacale]VEU79129.1 exodeoxyribonuclease V C-terminal fragment [Metamycoplasma cloacale]